MQSSYTKEAPTIQNDSHSRQAIDLQQSQLQQLQGLIHHLKQLIVQQETSISRFSPHLTLLIIATMAILINQQNLSWESLSPIHPLQPIRPEATSVNIIVQAGDPFVLPTNLNDNGGDVLFRAAVPQTTILAENVESPPQTTSLATTSSKSGDIQIYAVQSGDTISGIAAQFGLTAETIVWSNPALERNPDLLSVGQELIILPENGVYHQVGSGDTIAAIATTYQANIDAILNHPLNDFNPDNPIIQIGEWVMVPGGEKPFIPRTVTAYSGPAPADASIGSGIFGWPASGSITQGFTSYHPAIDIAAWIGAPVLAADSGYVVVAGWDNLYGYHIVLDHGNGFQSLYAHLQSYTVDAGENVTKGQQLGEMGSTGNSTGPHLHFELRQGTVTRNPYGFLP